MKLAVVIVNYNVRHYIAQCLDSVRKAIAVMQQDGMDAEVYVVDNHSQDDSVDYLRHNYPEVNLIASIYNLGFSRGNNLAIRDSESDYVLLLNPDTVVGEHSLLECCRYLDAHHDVGALGVRMMNSNGSDARESRRGLPTPLTSFYKILGLCRRYPDHPRYSRYYMGGMPWDKDGEIDVISGAFMMLRREALNQVGMLDEDYFMYGEDVDLSYRIKKGGWKNVYLPVRMLHYKGESTQHSSFRYVHVFYQAMLIFYEKHFAKSAWWFGIPIKIAIYLKAITALVSIQWYKMLGTLGLNRETRVNDIRYHFYVRESSLSSCQRIVRREGLQASFHISSEQDMKYHSASDIQNPEAKHCIIYDMSLYNYEDVLSTFASQSLPDVVIGFCHPSKEEIITPSNIFLRN